MKKHFWNTTYLCFLFLIVLAVAGRATTVEETFKKSISFQADGKLEVENVNGDIIVESWDKNEVYIEAEKRVKAGDRREAEKFMDELKIEIEESDNKIVIITRHPGKAHGGFWDWVFGDNVSSSINYKIRVPQKCNVEATSTNGGIHLNDIKGKFRLRTTNGKITAEALSGLVSARTTNGSVRVELKEVSSEEEMEFLTTNGSVTVYIPNSIDCDVRAKTTNGSIKTDFPMEVQGKYGSKHLRGKINDGGPMIFIETTNGSIKILET